MQPLGEFGIITRFAQRARVMWLEELGASEGVGGRGDAEERIDAGAMIDVAH